MLMHTYLLMEETQLLELEMITGAASQADERDKDVTFKNCAPFTKCISRINNTDIDKLKILIL